MTRKPRPRAILFDFDGVLIDSEPLHHRAFDGALVELGEEPVPFAEYAEHFSSGGRGREWIHDERPGVDYVRLHARKQEIFREFLETSVSLREHAAGAVERLAGRWPLALATNSWREHTEMVLRRLGLERWFPVVVTREDYERPKPDPDPFLVAAERLGVAATECIVVEDAYKGVEAARKAGARIIAVPNAYTRCGDFSAAAVVLDSMQDLTPEVVERAAG